MQAFEYGEDPALESLLLPFASGALAWPRAPRILFVHARDGVPLHASPRDALVCLQDFKPWADALQRAGLRRADAVDEERFAMTLLLPPRQREQARADLARAVRRTAIGGTLVAAMTNNEGARSGEADLRRLLGDVQSISKRHCRVFWGMVREESLDCPLLKEWATLDAPRPIADGRFSSRPGVFSSERIDAASALLADHLPGDLAGRCADLGAGFGYLATEVLARCPRVNALELYEADARALDLARSNLARVPSGTTTLDFLWHDVTAGLPRRYDAIVTNPPFHLGRADRPDLGRAFIAAAAAALLAGGRLLLVANRHLPYESALRERFARVHSLAEAQGFKVVEAIKPA